MDKAIRKTDKKLKDMEREIGRVYENSSALKQMIKKYADYMDMVQKRTERDFLAFQQEDDINDRERLKKLYTDKIRALTLDSVRYKKIIKQISDILSGLNQKALDIANAKMADIYTINYNQIAEDCRKIGIKVNGE